MNNRLHHLLSGLGKIQYNKFGISILDNNYPECN